LAAPKQKREGKKHLQFSDFWKLGNHPSFLVDSMCRLQGIWFAGTHIAMQRKLKHNP